MVTSGLPQRILMTAILGAAGFAMISVIDYLLTDADRHPYPNEPSPELIRIRFQEAVSAASGDPLYEATRFHRGRTVGIGQVFSVRYSAREVLADAEGKLSKIGWITVERRPEQARLNYIRLCKDGISATFDARSPLAGGRVYVGVTWALEQNHQDYCPL